MHPDRGCPLASDQKGHGGRQTTSGTGYPESGSDRALPPVQSGGDQSQLGDAHAQKYADQPAVYQQRCQHRCEKPFKVPGFARITGRGSFSWLPVRRVV